MTQIQKIIIPAMRTIIDQSNYKPGKAGREKNNLPSQTIPGETYTISDLLQRAMAGHPLQHNNYPYLDADDVEKIDRFFAPGSLDITDLQQLQERTAELEGIVQRALERKQAEDHPHKNRHDEDHVNRDEKGQFAAGQTEHEKEHHSEDK